LEEYRAIAEELASARRQNVVAPLTGYFLPSSDPGTLGSITTKTSTTRNPGTDTALKEARYVLEPQGMPALFATAERSDSLLSTRHPGSVWVFIK